jgi:hypothetical protein
MNGILAIIIYNKNETTEDIQEDRDGFFPTVPDFWNLSLREVVITLMQTYVEKHVFNYACAVSTSWRLKHRV